ncbi:10378_t:CDS:1, partial [Ambispora gerdemannii]
MSNYWDRTLSNEQEVLPNPEELPILLNLLTRTARRICVRFCFCKSKYNEPFDRINNSHPEIEISCVNILTETEFFDVKFEGSNIDEFVDVEFDSKHSVW